MLISASSTSPYMWLADGDSVMCYCHCQDVEADCLGIYHFLLGRGPSVCDRGSPIFFWCPLGMRKKILVPPLACAKKFWSPLGLRKKILVPPPLRERTPPYINTEAIQMPVPYDD